MAFLDDSDLAPKPAPVAAPAAAPVTVIQAAPRSKLVPILLITLNLGVVVILLLVLAPSLKLPTISFGGGESAPPVADAGSLDPALLVTPTGRKLDVVVFGNAVFEVTRVAYYPDVRSRSVTITVPGAPPQQAVFRVGESFAGGRIRVVDIQQSGVMLEASGQQKLFGTEGSTSADQWDKPSQPAGTSMIPARNNSVIPDLPSGQVRPAIDPRTQPQDPPKTESAKEAASEPGKEPAADEDWSLEDLPLETFVDLERREFDDLLIKLVETFDRDFVLAPALEADTRIPFGLEIKNLRASNAIAVRLQKGDIILAVNGEKTTRITDLDLALRHLRTATEIAIDIQREDEIQTFIFRPGAPLPAGKSK